MPTKEQQFAQNFPVQDGDLLAVDDFTEAEPNDWVEEKQVEPEITDWVEEVAPTKQPEQPKYSSQMLGDSFKQSQELIGGNVNANLMGAYKGATAGVGPMIQALGGGAVGYVADKALGNDRSFNENYTDALENVRKREKIAKEKYPIAYGVGEVEGLIGTGVKTAGTKTAAAINNSIRRGLLPNATTSIGRAANLGTKAAQAGAISAASGAEYGFATGEGGFDNRTKQAEEFAIPSGAIGAATILTPAAVKAGAKALTPTVDEGIKEVGRLAQKYNIPLSIDQITNSKAIKTAQKASQELPFSGQAGFRDKQVAAWNRAVTKTLGEESDRITPEFIDNRFTALGKQFNNLGKGEVHSPSAITSKVNSIVQDAIDAGASKEATDGFRNFVKREINSNLNPDGTIKGETLNKIRAKANATARNSNNFDSKTLYHNFESEIIDTLLPDTLAKKEFSQLKGQYKNLLAIEPLLKSEKGGVISPTLLSNRMGAVFGRQYYRGKAGELGELARIGKQLLPELGGSDTFQKGLFAGSVLTGAANPATIPLMVGGVAANRAAQSGINRNQAIIRKLLGSSSKVSLPPAVGGSSVSLATVINNKPTTREAADKIDMMLDNIKTGRINSQNDIQRSPIFKEYFDGVMEELNSATKGERYFRDAEIGGSPDVIGFNGTFPEWFTQANKDGAGITKKYVKDVVEKAARGEKLAAKEQSVYDSVKSKAEELMQADHYDLERALSDYGLDMNSMSNKEIKQALQEIQSSSDDVINDIPFEPLPVTVKPATEETKQAAKSAPNKLTDIIKTKKD